MNIARGSTVVLCSCLALAQPAAAVERDKGAASTRMVHDGASTIADLRDRDVGNPVPNGQCPDAQANLQLDGVGPMLRAGPVAAAALSEEPLLAFVRDPGQRRHGVKILWLVDAEQRGPVIVRGTRIDKTGSVTFAGGVGRGDRVLSLSGDVSSTAPPTWRDIPSAMLIRGAGCYLLQVDGTDFQSVFLLRAAPRVPFS